MRLISCSPTRMALAMAVTAGFTAPMPGKKLVSATYRLSHDYHVIVPGHDPIVEVPGSAGLTRQR